MKTKLDLWGNKIISPPKCSLCGKKRGEHKALTLHCPIGKKKQYAHFHLTEVYTPKETK